MHLYSTPAVPSLTLRTSPQDCLATGKPLLIENIEEELDPVLDPVLERRVIRQARGLILQLADKEARALPCCLLPSTRMWTSACWLQ